MDGSLDLNGYPLHRKMLVVGNCLLLNTQDGSVFYPLDVIGVVHIVKERNQLRISSKLGSNIGDYNYNNLTRYLLIVNVLARMSSEELVVSSGTKLEDMKFSLRPKKKD